MKPHFFHFGNNLIPLIKKEGSNYAPTLIVKWSRKYFFVWRFFWTHVCFFKSKFIRNWQLFGKIIFCIFWNVHNCVWYYSLITIRSWPEIIHEQYKLKTLLLEQTLLWAELPAKLFQIYKSFKRLLNELGLKGHNLVNIYISLKIYLIFRWSHSYY